MRIIKSKQTAGISPIVFHATQATLAATILKTNKFKLKSFMSNVSERRLKEDRQDLFYMSVARTRVNRFFFVELDYIRFVVFELDGRKLSSVAKGVAVDYFHKEGKPSDRGLWHSYEQEDRIYSIRPEIINASKYIKEIHIVKPRGLNPWTAKQISDILKYAEKYKIPVSVYSSANNFMQRKKGIDYDEFKKDIKKLSRGHEKIDKPSQDNTDLNEDFLLDILDFIDAQNKSTKSYTKKFVHDRVLRIAKKHLSLRADIVAHRIFLGYSGDSYEWNFVNPVKLSLRMRKYKLRNIKELIDFIGEQLTQIKEKGK